MSSKEVATCVMCGKNLDFTIEDIAYHAIFYNWEMQYCDDCLESKKEEDNYDEE